MPIPRTHPTARQALASLARVLAVCAAFVLSHATPDALAQPAATTDDKSISIVEAIEAIPSAQRPPNRFALLIGVDEYADKRITRLDACVRDATTLADVLRDGHAGMFPEQNVTVLTNQQVTRRNVMRALARLAEQAGPNDLVVVFYSGHGMVDPEGRGYWVMHDTEPDDPAGTALSRLDIDDRLKKIASNRLVTIIDACHAAATAEVGKTKAALNLDTILPQFDGQGRVVLTSSDANQLSVTIPSNTNQPGAGHSAFAWHIIEGLRGAAADDNGVVTVDGLWNFVKDRTERTARQQGGNQRPRLEGTIDGRFLLAVNAERIRENQARIRAAQGQTKARVERLAALLKDRQITAGQFDEGRTLIEADEASLSDAQRGRRSAYVDLVEDRLRPAFLAGVLAQFPLEAPASAQPTAPAPTPANDPAARLARLSELVSTGVLTQDQFFEAGRLFAAPDASLSAVHHRRRNAYGTAISGNLTRELLTGLLRDAGEDYRWPSGPQAIRTEQREGGLIIEDVVVGNGREVGDTPILATVHYRGAVLDSGVEFDSSIARNEPNTFPLNDNKIIQGWELGTRGMRVGGTRRLLIPPALAYGEKGAGGLIPPNATLLFEVQLLDLAELPRPQPAPTQPAAPTQPNTPAPAATPDAITLVTLDTTLGEIVIELNQAKAPVTVANFLQYVNDGFYDGTIFHRVIPNFVIQGGGYTQELAPKATRPPIINESGNGLTHTRGTVAMARTRDPNSANAQFYINVRDNPQLDQARDGAAYAVFGRVVRGMDVVDRIAAEPTGTSGPMTDVPRKPVVMRTVRRVASGAGQSPTPASGATPDPNAPIAAIRTLEGHSDGVTSAAFSPDGDLIVTASKDRTAVIWDAGSDQRLRTLSGHTGWVYSVAFSPDSRSVVTASGDDTATTWDAASGQRLRTLRGHRGQVLSAAYSPNGDLIVTASKDRTAVIWDAGSGRRVRSLNRHEDFVTSAGFSPDSRRILTTSMDKSWAIWDASSGQRVEPLSGEVNFGLQGSFSVDGRMIVVAAAGNVSLWDAASGQRLRNLGEPTVGAMSAAFSPDGRFIVTASGDNTAVVWDATSGQRLRTLSGHSKGVLSAAFSPDGRFIVTASEDKTAKIWPFTP